MITGATIVCFSFIGFDAITMYTEEAKDAQHRAAGHHDRRLLIGGAIFFIAGWFAQSRVPDDGRLQRGRAGEQRAARDRRA
ncbi:MAG: hypothetical protein V9F04_17850 [Dermatophilaceae bacterium]